MAKHERARLLRDDHSRIRLLVADVGLTFDMRASREAATLVPQDALKRHTSREDATLYRYATREPPFPLWDRVRVRTSERARSAMPSDGPPPSRRR